MPLLKTLVAFLALSETSSALSLVSVEEEAVDLVQLTFNTSLGGGADGAAAAAESEGAGAPTLQLAAAAASPRAALGWGAGSRSRAEGDASAAAAAEEEGASMSMLQLGEIHKLVRAKVQGGLESFSEEQKLSAFDLIHRVMQDGNLSFIQKRTKLLEEIAKSFVPERLSKGLGKQWVQDMVTADESKGGDKLHCLETKVHLPLALFEVVMAVIGTMKCHGPLMCVAEAIEIFAAIGQTTSHFHGSKGQCTASHPTEVICAGAHEQVGAAVYGTLSAALALANQCDHHHAHKPVGTCPTHATFAGGWGLLAGMIVVMMGTDMSHWQHHVLDVVYAGSMFSKMVMESVTLCTKEKNYDILCGTEAAYLLGWLGSGASGGMKIKEICPDMDKLCSVDEPEMSFWQGTFCFGSQSMGPLDVGGTW